MLTFGISTEDRSFLASKNGCRGIISVVYILIILIIRSITKHVLSKWFQYTLLAKSHNKGNSPKIPPTLHRHSRMSRVHIFSIENEPMTSASYTINNKEFKRWFYYRIIRSLDFPFTVRVVGKRSWKWNQLAHVCLQLFVWNNENKTNIKNAKLVDTKIVNTFNL